MAADPITLFAGLPAAWQSKLSQRLGPAHVLSSRLDERGGAGLPVICLHHNESGDDVRTIENVTTAVIGALAAPQAESLEAAMTALEAAVDLNAVQPIQELTAIARGMLAQQAGRMLVVTYDPRALTAPHDAPTRASARGIFAYCESLRPAFKLRGIHLGLLLLAPRKPGPWDLVAYTDAVVPAIADCLQKSTLQRKLTIS